MAYNDWLQNYHHKRLNQLVIPGSHDAGIYGQGKKNVITQKLNIGEQARAGVRWFDLRIATCKNNGTFTHRAYHLNQNFVRNSKHRIFNRKVKSHQNVSHLGGWGDCLTSMLAQARKFVEDNPSEFLMLKFSKSYNMKSIADSCLAGLGDYQYFPGVKINLNMANVGGLAGKVITIFSDKDLSTMNLPGGPLGFYGGCLAFSELWDNDTQSSKVYQRDYNGLQYFGKFSSTDDIDKNTRKQRDILEKGAQGADRDAMGMMYWTTTGLFSSILDRNKKMWNVTNVKALQQTWEHGLKKAMQAQMGRDFHNARQTGGRTIGRNGMWESFIPNIVMLDFADENKCKTVIELNQVNDQMIAQIMHDMGGII